jgi:hypothetical protein
MKTEDQTSICSAIIEFSYSAPKISKIILSANNVVPKPIGILIMTIYTKIRFISKSK